MSLPEQCSVVIAGGGPCGLMLAIELGRRGVSAALVDQKPERPSTRRPTPPRRGRWGGTLGLLIPPSVILVVYGISTEQNIAKLFMAALIPGLLAVCQVSPGLGRRRRSFSAKPRPNFRPQRRTLSWVASAKRAGSASLRPGTKKVAASP